MVGTEHRAPRPFTRGQLATDSGRVAQGNGGNGPPIARGAPPGDCDADSHPVRTAARRPSPETSARACPHDKTQHPHPPANGVAWLRRARATPRSPRRKASASRALCLQPGCRVRAQGLRPHVEPGLPQEGGRGRSACSPGRRRTAAETSRVAAAVETGRAAHKVTAGYAAYTF